MSGENHTSDAARANVGQGLSADQLEFLNSKVAPRIGAMLGSLFGLALFLPLMLSLPLGDPLSGSRWVDVIVALGLVGCLTLVFAFRLLRIFSPRRS